MRLGRFIAANAFVVFLVWMIFGVIGGFAYPYAINEWLSFFGKENTIVWWQGFVLGLIPGIGQASLPVAAVTWVLMLFLG